MNYKKSMRITLTILMTIGSINAFGKSLENECAYDNDAISNEKQCTHCENMFYTQYSDRYHTDMFDDADFRLKMGDTLDMPFLDGR